MTTAPIDIPPVSSLSTPVSLGSRASHDSDATPSAIYKSITKPRIKGPLIENKDSKMPY